MYLTMNILRRQILRATHKEISYLTFFLESIVIFKFIVKMNLDVDRGKKANLTI